MVLPAGRRQTNHGGGHDDKTHTLADSARPRGNHRAAVVGRSRIGSTGGLCNQRPGCIGRAICLAGSDAASTGRQTAAAARKRSGEPAGPRPTRHSAAAHTDRQEAAGCSQQLGHTAYGQRGVKPDPRRRGRSVRGDARRADAPEVPRPTLARSKSTQLSPGANCARLNCRSGYGSSEVRSCEQRPQPRPATPLRAPGGRRKRQRSPRNLRNALRSQRCTARTGAGSRS